LRSFLQRWWHGSPAQLKRRWRDRRGSAAVEFALIVPILIATYVGAVETGNALTIYRRVDQIAYTSADLVAQVKTVSNSDLQDITDAATSILAPYSTAPLNIVLTSVVADSNNKTTVAWSYTTGSGAHPVGSTYALPTGLTAANSSVIVAEVTYLYTPLLDLDISTNGTSFTMSKTFYSRPRLSLTVAKSD
jgi:Flp pilus assembly protein TadG